MSLKSFPLVIPTIQGNEEASNVIKSIQYAPRKEDVVKVIKHAIHEEQNSSPPEGYVTGRLQLIKDLFGRTDDSTENLEAELEHAMVKSVSGCIEELGTGRFKEL